MLPAGNMDQLHGDSPIAFALNTTRLPAGNNIKHLYPPVLKSKMSVNGKPDLRPPPTRPRLPSRPQPLAPPTADASLFHHPRQLRPRWAAPGSPAQSSPLSILPAAFVSTDEISPSKPLRRSSRAPLVQPIPPLQDLRLDLPLAAAEPESPFPTSNSQLPSAAPLQTQSRGSWASSDSEGLDPPPGSEQASRDTYSTRRNDTHTTIHPVASNEVGTVHVPVGIGDPISMHASASSDHASWEPESEAATPLEPPSLVAATAEAGRRRFQDRWLQGDDLRNALDLLHRSWEPECSCSTYLVL